VRTARIALPPLLVVFLAVALFPPTAEARPRVRARASVAVGVGYGPAYYHPVFYDPFAWGAYGWYPYPWGPGRYYRPYPVWGYDPAASLRIQSTPREAQVYVDGYFVGIVDDFDGWSQRLRLAPGEYEVQLHLEGYRTVTERMLLRPGTTYRLRRDMEPLRPGEPQDPRPEPSSGGGSGPGAGGPPPSAAPPDRYPSDAGRTAPPRVRPEGGFGTIAVRVRPADAEIYVNGERWDRPAGDDRLLVDVAAGTHTIEVRKEGFATYTAQIDVRSGRVTNVNVSLPER
jgi:hypothetical protein